MNYVDFFIFNPIKTLEYHIPRYFIDRKNARTVDRKQCLLDQNGALGSKKKYHFNYNN